MGREQGDSNGVQAHLSRSEKIFLAGLATICLSVAVAFAAISVFWSYGFPATLVAFLLGVALATLSYAFLGGVQGNEVRFGGVTVAGTAAVVIAILIFVPKPLHKEMNELEMIKIGRESEQTIKALAGAAGRRGSLLIDTGMSAQPIAGGGTVKLINIRATKGQLNRLPRQGRLRALEQLLEKARITADAAEVVKMSPGELEEFLAGQSRQARDRFSEVPFAELEIASSDQEVKRETVFSQTGAIAVLNRGGEPEAFICVRRLFDVQETGSLEREAAVLDHSAKRCV